jgi:ADP-ribosylglycohydrolase
MPKRETVKKAKNAMLFLACGDAYGNVYEMDGLYGRHFAIEELPDKAVVKRFTDDTKMALIL